jgi:hypothetical protein
MTRDLCSLCTMQVKGPSCFEVSVWRIFEKTMSGAAFVQLILICEL